VPLSSLSASTMRRSLAPSTPCCAYTFRSHRGERVEALELSCGQRDLDSGMLCLNLGWAARSASSVNQLCMGCSPRDHIARIAQHARIVRTRLNIFPCSPPAPMRLSMVCNALCSSSFTLSDPV
jgi:hypothetical protein